MFHILWSIIVGFFVGLIARSLMFGDQHLDFIPTVLLGIGGSFLGGLLGQLLSKPAPGAKFHPAGIFMSIVGAIILLWAYTKWH